MPDWSFVYERLRSRIEAMGVRVHARPLGFETTGIFDGLSITTNTNFDIETCCHNIAHSLGHIAQWSLDYAHFHDLYVELNAAKANKQHDPAALERALRRFHEYEEESSQYAVWLLIDTGCADALPGFTLFARADIEAIVAFHRDGLAPVWLPFFADWCERAQCGTLEVRSFEPKPIPRFTPIPIEAQEVIQEVDGQI